MLLFMILLRLRLVLLTILPLLLILLALFPPPHLLASAADTVAAARSLRAWRSVAGCAVGIGGCMCYAMGLAGYLSFRDAVDGDILENFSGAVASVFKAVVVVHLILYIPSEVIVLRFFLHKNKCVLLLLLLLLLVFVFLRTPWFQVAGLAFLFL